MHHAFNEIRISYIVKREASIEAGRAGIFSEKSAVVNHAFSPRLDNVSLSHGARAENNTKGGERQGKSIYY